MLGIGVKVNTLPVVALGVGVGVDYGIYLFERMKHEMEDNALALKDAFVEALKQRGLSVTRLARGVPAGSELEYVDLGTIAHALVDRR